MGKTRVREGEDGRPGSSEGGTIDPASPQKRKSSLATQVETGNLLESMQWRAGTSMNNRDSGVHDEHMRMPGALPAWQNIRRRLFELQIPAQRSHDLLYCQSKFQCSIKSGEWVERTRPISEFCQPRGEDSLRKTPGELLTFRECRGLQIWIDG